MRIRLHVAMAGLATVMALTGASAADASRSISTSGTGSLGYGSNLSFAAEEFSFTCSVTLQASLHRAFAKTRDSLAGHFNEWRLSNCQNSLGQRMIAVPLVSFGSPWHITYESFGGTLPRITEALFLIKRFSWLASIDGLVGSIGCIIGGDLPIGTTGTGGASEYTIRGLVVLANRMSLLGSLAEETFIRCPERWEVRGRFTAQAATTLRLT